MKPTRKVGILIIIILVVMQFIQPTRNRSDELISTNDISHVYAMPQELHQTFVTKCYDCHSNNTKYPWYVNLQPIGWWLAAHVHEGKEHLNFSEFKTYPAEEARDKLEEIGEVTRERSMPIEAYTLFHEHAQLTAKDEKEIFDWLSTLSITVD
ncbi:MAG TPA: heme-binding domain-containing protein [Chryseosolibacter sp.]